VKLFEKTILLFPHWACRY